MGPRRWKRRVLNLGSSLSELWRAEVAALQEDLVASARRVGGASILLLVGGILLLWALGALTLTAFEALAIVLPRWAAGTILTAVLGLVGAILLIAGRGRIRKTETPTQTVRRHVEEHREWWEREVLHEDQEDVGGRRG
jgi:hypothetical protein